MPAHNAVANLEGASAQGWDQAIAFTAGDLTCDDVVCGDLTASGPAILSDTLNVTNAIVGSSSIQAGNSIKSTNSSAGVGYGTGAGGSVTQITNRATGVTLNTICGKIQTDTTSLAAGASAEFTVTNSAVALNDVVVVSQQSGSSNVAGVAGTTHVHVVTVAASSFILSVDNQSTTTAETGAIIINFAVIKAVAA